MRVAWVVFLIGLLFFSSAQLNSQQVSTTIQQDAQAIAILRKSIAAMGTTVPTDSSATGTVTIVEGSTAQSGPIQILTRGITQTIETLSLPDGQRSNIYSNGDAKEILGTQSQNPPLELIVTEQSVLFPIPFLTALVRNADESIRYIGRETLDGSPVQHIEVSNTFASKPRLKKLAPFSTTNIWFDASSGLPLKISYFRRAGGGAVPSVPVEVHLSNYTPVSGVLYPFQIQRSLNGTPWQTITIQNVSFGVGLADAQFQTE
jgi:hypothetical protein